MIGKSTKSSRNLKVASVLHRAISEVLLREYFDLKKIFTVSDVEVSCDLKNANIFIIPCNDQSDHSLLIKDLNEISHVIRKSIFKYVDLRFTPKLYFKLDNSFYNLMTISKLLNL